MLSTWFYYSLNVNYNMLSNKVKSSYNTSYTYTSYLECLILFWLYKKLKYRCYFDLYIFIVIIDEIDLENGRHFNYIYI